MKKFTKNIKKFGYKKNNDNWITFVFDERWAPSKQKYFKVYRVVAVINGKIKHEMEYRSYELALQKYQKYLKILK